jgi:hypothetical protein
MQVYLFLSSVNLAFDYAIVMEMQLGHEADHSPPSSAQVKNAWSYTSTPQYIFMAWCLIKHRIHLHGMAFS